MTDKHSQFMRRAIELARLGMEQNQGGPFGSVIVKDGRIIGEGCNRVTSTNDPTAHAEIVAIREACGRLNSFQLEGCTVYASCEPCPMCMAAIYWARPEAVFFACSREDAAAIGFDDEFLYEEIVKPIGSRRMPTENILRDEAIGVFRIWAEKADKTAY